MRTLPIFAVMAAALALAGCKNSRTLLPNVSGKAGEVIVVMEKADWDSSLGESTRGLLASECPWLPVTEPLYTLVNVAPGGFVDLFKVHRNIVFFDINARNAGAHTILRKDMWAEPQCVVQIQASCAAQADSLVNADGAKIVAAIEQAERDRVIHNSILYENKNLAPVVRGIFGGSPHFPTGYKMKKHTDSFAWIADDKQYTYQDILIYSYPVTGERDLELDNIIAHRNEILGRNIPGMRENSHMTTGTYFTPTVEYIRYKGRNFAQVRGLWELENDYMGGPFVSHSFYSPDGTKIIVAEAFVYAPKYDKRQLLRQVESILYSWEWEKAEDI